MPVSVIAVTERLNGVRSVTVSGGRPVKARRCVAGRSSTLTSSDVSTPEAPSLVAHRIVVLVETVVTTVSAVPASWYETSAVVRLRRSGSVNAGIAMSKDVSVGSWLAAETRRSVRSTESGSASDGSASRTVKSPAHASCATSSVSDEKLATPASPSRDERSPPSATPAPPPPPPPPPPPLLDMQPGGEASSVATMGWERHGSPHSTSVAASPRSSRSATARRGSASTPPPTGSGSAATGPPSGSHCVSIGSKERAHARSSSAVATDGESGTDASLAAVTNERARA